MGSTEDGPTAAETPDEDSAGPVEDFAAAGPVPEDAANRTRGDEPATEELQRPDRPGQP